MSIRQTTKKCLFDIWEAALSIERFTEGIDAEMFGANELIQAAVERKFEVIGEALNRIYREDEEILAQIRDYSRIIGFRNILAHGYDVVDSLLVWSIVNDHLPILKSDVDTLLQS